MTTPRTYRRHLVSSLLVAGALTLSACSSDDDGPSTDTETNGTDETSMLAPGEDMNGEVDMTPIAYVIPLTVEEEIPPPVGADGASGQASLVFDPATRGMTGTITTSGLTGAPTMAHIHEQPAGEPTGDPIIFFVEDGSGTGFALADDVILTEEQAESLETGLLYVNVHTEMNVPGEIRGQIVLQEEEDN